MVESHELKRTQPGALSRLTEVVSEVAISGARIAAVGVCSITLAVLDRFIYTEGDPAGECPIERVSYRSESDIYEDLAA